MKRKSLKMLFSLGLSLFLMPIHGLADGEVSLGNIADKIQGAEVNVTGTSIYPDVNVKVMNSNDSIILVDSMKVTNQQFNYTFKLPNTVPLGKATVVVGENTHVVAKSFQIVTPPPTGGGGGGGGGGISNPTSPTPTGTTRTVDVVVGNKNNQDSKTTATQVEITRNVTENGTKVDTVTLNQEKTEQAVTKAMQEKNTNVEIVVTDIPGDPAQVVSVNLANSSMNQLIANQLTLNITTPQAKLELSTETMTAIQNVTSVPKIEIQKVTAPAQVQQTIETAAVVAPNSRIVGTPVEIHTNFSSKTQVTIPIEQDRLPSSPQELQVLMDSLAVLVEHSDGDKEVIKGEILFDDQGKPSNITFWVDKFSTFTVIGLDKQTEGKLLAEGKLKVQGSLIDIRGHWAEQEIRSFIQSRMISGYPDGTFRPNQTITRAEFASLLVKVFKLEERPGKVFDDIQGHWASKDIQTASAYGIIKGFSDSRFGPNEKITREQMATMMSLAKKWENITGNANYLDTEQIAGWAKDYVQAATKHQVMNGYPDQTFKPKKHTTRAEAVVVLFASMSK
ncbi:S-layer homology domain-containing protein [Ammoniphilus sp. CFH 90114]|uniref:S-layer homology domain-containing protein n=1 Tax=Ammoniphilus sp. CFH 90114 TaxID=2493665 RepID=UPI00100F35C5|nr:S-layer homology domain-containing protein [Ammoniphilus sp. CFH 90114]RXT04583.1 S-layer homology domain-containing protein [Ammoniphilus sp. CFH 90114]